MQTIIQNKLSSMLDELLDKALETKPKKIEEGYRYNSYLFKWENFIMLIKPDEEKQEITILLPRCYNVGWGKFVIDNIPFHFNYIPNYTDKQKELINKIFQKWGNTDDRNSK